MNNPMTTTRSVQFVSGTVEHHTSQLFDELHVLESNITILRRNLAKGKVSEDLNIVAAADRIARRTAKLSMLIDVFDALDQTDKEVEQ